ncbi:Phospholipase Blike protein, putative [Acanthamoeba castellanii str. Neff]|uniref:Phospholipase B-like n=1 Tax=Acanthamoeba castellanii (strain ATCC 30010 / Neff) TaxID=1257118 RepID=L8H8D7_ACACF|nr:Phospholipase Blike protein, putative [Acanthamoeba castellanii str. Neff]ELR21430.1 Phospholipase Blike protein, putative [Acanthamoeba castellanii str. Neff]
MKSVGLLVGGLVVLLAFAAWSAHSLEGTATVYYDPATKHIYLLPGRVDLRHGAAVGEYHDHIEKDGWGKLSIEGNPLHEDETQMFAAGYLEGAMTQKRIYQQYTNIHSVFWHNATTIPASLQAWLKAQDKWVRDNAAEKRAADPYWGQVANVLAQFDGLVKGYNDFAPALPGRPPRNMMSEDQLRNWVYNTHCSALIKVTGDLSDIFAGHTAWFSYESMLRIAKSYTLPLSNPSTQSKSVIFSSYPGFLVSLDDFYITDKELVVIETSLSVFNESLYTIVRDNTQVLLSWQRTMLANRMASSGPQWASTYSRYQSGTYNNQWMVLDTKRFEQGVQLNPYTLTILEQIPGYIQWDDQTSILAEGYWPSYNVPFYPRVYEAAGYVEMAQKQPVMASYQHCCRANIFRRDQGNVTDFEAFKSILRYNDWQNDPYSQGHPGYSIAARFDLEKSNPSPEGGYDTKATSYARVKQMKFEAINGPTYQEQPVFAWTSQWDAYSHVGQPLRFHFPFVTMQPAQFQ